MDSTKSFKSYSKADELEEQTYRKKTRKRMITIVFSTIILIAIIIGAVLGTIFPVKSSKSLENPATYTARENINAICNVTQYPDSCDSSIAALRSSSNATNQNPGPAEIFRLSMQVAVNELIRLLSLLQKIISSYVNTDPLVRGALEDCDTLFKDAVEYINESISSVQVGQGEKMLLSAAKINDILTWLSSAITNQETCLDGLTEAANQTVIRQEVEHAMRNSTEFSSNSLAIASQIMTILHRFQVPIHRKLLKLDSQGHIYESDWGFPHWVHSGDRRLLQEENPKPDLTVAQDGTGDFRTINEAVELIPKKNKSRYVIYVKEGLYLENVKIDKDYWNVMIYGDGMYKTIVSGSLNKVDGTPTFSSGTVTVTGDGFIARDIGFQNTAGPQGEQALALYVASDHSVFYRCSIAGYQDTLYALSLRQFYRDCDIYGTIDFIFGNAAAVFQSCTLALRRPHGGYNVILANGRSDPGQNTGFSIQNCRIVPSSDFSPVKHSFNSYLGRPWKQYSRAVVMESTIDDAIASRGWIEWPGAGAYSKSLYFGEYANGGPGAGTSGRVTWPGFHVIGPDEAVKFTVDKFIAGTLWLPSTGVTFDSGLQ
ncbi:hypothetical protein REPUB_Repub03eG0051600 [Reevesia pubescens]